MAATGRGYEQLGHDLSALTELAVAICLTPCDDPQPADPATREEAEELLLVAQEIKAKLDVFLTDDVRADVVQLIEHLDQNRERYRLSLLRFVDLMEDITYSVEDRYGDGAGPLKQREARAAMYYLLEGFFGPQGLPTVPPWMRPVLLEVIVRITVEFLVTLDNPPDESIALWNDLRSRRGPPKVRLLETRVRFAKYRESAGERMVGWMIQIFMPKPFLTGRLRTSVDAILSDWTERNRLTGTIPMQRLLQPFVQTALWAGQHGKEVRAAIDAVSMTVYATARFTRLDRDQQLEVVKEAVVMMFEDLGYRTPMFRTVVRFMVDMMADATDNLFRKRGVIRE
jgi:hypothetical protein